MKKSTVFVIILAALALAARGGSSKETEVAAEPVVVEPEPIVVEEAAPAVEEVVVEEPVAAEPVAAEPVSASGSSSYTSPDGVFTMDVPAGWAMETDTWERGWARRTRYPRRSARARSARRSRCSAFP